MGITITTGGMILPVDSHDLLSWLRLLSSSKTRAAPSTFAPRLRRSKESHTQGWPSLRCNSTVKKYPGLTSKKSRKSFNVFFGCIHYVQFLKTTTKCSFLIILCYSFQLHPNCKYIVLKKEMTPNCIPNTADQLHKRSDPNFRRTSCLKLCATHQLFKTGSSSSITTWQESGPAMPGPIGWNLFHAVPGAWCRSFETSKLQTLLGNSCSGNSYSTLGV